MFINKDPVGNIYESLLDFSFEVCDEFMFIIRLTPCPINDKAKKLVEDLTPYLKWCSKESGWIGTLCSDPAMVYYYYVNNETKEIIKNVSRSLHSWRHPNLPEDFCLVKNGEPWLINTSHEFCSYIKTNNKEEIYRIINMGLDVSLDEHEKKILNH